MSKSININNLVRPRGRQHGFNLRPSFKCNTPECDTIVSDAISPTQKYCKQCAKDRQAERVRTNDQKKRNSRTSSTNT